MAKLVARLRRQDGSLVIDVLIGLALGAIVLGVGVAAATWAGKSTRVAEGSVVAQSRLIDTVSRMTRDVAAANPIKQATTTTLAVETKTSTGCQYTKYVRGADNKLVSTTTHYNDTGCPDWDVNGAMPAGDTSSTETLLPKLTNQTPTFQYFDGDDNNISAAADDNRTMIRRVQFDMTAAVNERPSGVTLRTSAVPRATNPDTGESSDPVPAMGTPVLSGCRAATFSSPCPVASGNDAQLRWALPQGADSYVLLRAQAPGQSFAVIGSYPTANPALPVADPGALVAQPGETVRRLYQIYAVNGTTGQVTQSNVVTLQNQGTMPDLKSNVTGACAIVGGTWQTTATVVWQTVPSATGYRIRVNGVDRAFTATDTTYLGEPAKQAVLSQTTPTATYEVWLDSPGGAQQIDQTKTINACTAPQASCARGSGETTSSSPHVVTVASGRPWELYAASGSGSSATPTGPVLTSRSSGTGTWAVSMGRGARAGFVAVGQQPDNSTVMTYVECVSRPNAPTVSVSLEDAAGANSNSGATNPSSNNRIRLAFPQVAGADSYRVFLRYQEPGCTTDPTCRSPFEAYKAWSAWTQVSTIDAATWTGSQLYTNWAAAAAPLWSTRFQLAVYAVNASADDNAADNSGTTAPSGCPGGCPNVANANAGWSGPAGTAVRRLHSLPPAATITRSHFATGPTDIRYDVRMDWGTWLMGANAFTVHRDSTSLGVSAATDWGVGGKRLFDRARPAGSTSPYTVAANCDTDAECFPNAAKSTDVTTSITMGPGAPGTLTASWDGTRTWVLNWGAAPGATSYQVFTESGYNRTVAGVSTSIVEPPTWPEGGFERFYVVPANGQGTGPRSNVAAASAPNGIHGVVASNTFTGGGRTETMYKWSGRQYLATCMDLYLQGINAAPTSYGSWTTGIADGNNPRKWNQRLGRYMELISNPEIDAISRVLQLRGEPHSWTEQVSLDGVFRFWTVADGDTTTGGKLISRSLAAGAYQGLMNNYWAEGLNNMLPWRGIHNGLPGWKWLDNRQCVNVQIQTSRGEQALPPAWNTMPISKTNYSSWKTGQTVTVHMSNVQSQPGTLTTNAFGAVDICFTPTDPTTPVVAWITVPGTPFSESTDPGARSSYQTLTGSSSTQRYFRGGLSSTLIQEVFRYNLD